VSPPVFLVAPGDLDPDRVVLAGPEGRHAATVQRLAPGERVDLTDGAGLLAECVVRATGRDRLDLDVVARHRWPRPTPRLVVVQALPKGDRGELAVEMMTEAGVDVIVPWAASRCVTRWRAERGEKALRRWRNAARAALKQSRGPWSPMVTDLVTTARVGELLAGAALAVVLHEAATTPLSDLSVPHGERGDVGSQGDWAPAEIVVVVGPEGGITADELATFEAAGGTAVRLGPTVLRTSTAGVAASAVLLSRCGRW
jgi:16S rRNA (uracil1498-N3)-methyltransferase